METQKIKSKMKIKETGSFFNLMMGNNTTLPVIGKGATILHWTDRSAYEVISVSDDYKNVVIQRYEPKRLDSYGMSDSQDYEYKELTNLVKKIVFINGGWKEEYITVELYKDINFDLLTKEQKESLHPKDWFNYGYKHVEGLTRQKKTYRKLNIIFGVKREYHYYSF